MAVEGPSVNRRQRPPCRARGGGDRLDVLEI